MKNKEKKKLEFTLIIIQLNQKKQSVIEIHLSFVYIQKKTNNVFKKKKKRRRSIFSITAQTTNLYTRMFIAKILFNV